ncbi:uncharacterized protein LOC124169361 [Ischnura elegans]|uniref:uncharacterized protein LOC124169361 n=1 Tax=Ischnura elegans TaxID=197161 RepID=UPI001ED8BCFE|nr:uncharacterized protein LOC124169361 [Ischnura elegans]
MAAPPPPKVLLFAGVLLAAFLVAPSDSAGILDVVSWGLDYVIDMTPKEKRDGETEEAPRNCFCQSSLNCVCCMELPLVEFTGPGCVQMKYLSESESMAVNVSYGGNVLHTDVIKGPNPEPSCMNIISDWAQICARFNDLSPADDGMRACLQFEPVLFGEIQTQYPVGCFHMGPSGLNFNTTPPLSVVESVIGSVNSNETSNDNSTTTQEGISEAALLAAVNESAEEGIAFFSNLLGLTFGGANNADGQNSTSEAETSETSASVPQISTEANLHETSRKE